MLKLVLDANTIISAFLWEGNEAELFRKIENKKAELYSSFEIVKEIEDVLKRAKFKELIIKSGLTIEEIMQKIISLSNMAFGKKLTINACRDWNDNKILECAKLAGADIIVSGDEDLLVLKEFEGIKILNTKEVLKILK